MNASANEYNKSRKRFLLLPTLMLSSFLAICSLVFISTLLPDIAKSFQVSIGTASLIGLVGGLVGLALGLAMGALTLRFNHKALFLTGIASLCVGIIVLYLAPNFATAILASLFTGLGMSTIMIMSPTFIGELLPLQKRGMAIGLTTSTVFLSFVVAAPLFGEISQEWGWRSVLITFSFPISLACFAFGVLFLPSNLAQGRSPKTRVYSEAFKQILKNKSAVACLVGSALLAFLNTLPTYAVSFYRIQFSVSALTGGTFSSIVAVGGLFSALSSGALINRCGRKTLAVVGAFVAGVGAIAFTLIPNMAMSVSFWIVSASFAAVTMTSLNTLALEQVPAFRASMMSISSTFGSIGSILGVAAGGLVLNLYNNNFQILMPIFGVGSVASAITLTLLAKDPCKTKRSFPNPP